jgi:transcriptional regulator with PAS, ATPase and Fis domain
MSICLNIISGLFTPYRVSSSIFSDVRNLMLDYVFIIGEKGEIIYKNNRVEKAGIFSDAKSINIQDISKIFDKKIINRYAYNKQFIKYLGENSIYFAYRKKPLKEDEKIVGYIITFTDITELINMLDELKEKQEITAKANTKLLHYKDIVYDVEKEKEIYNLLDQIANNQQISMIKLKHDIENLKDNMDDDFIEKIAEIITIAKLNLQDVRDAVTAYRNYYGGEND